MWVKYYHFIWGKPQPNWDWGLRELFFISKSTFKGIWNERKFNNEIPEKRFIYEEESQNSKNGFFRKEHFLSSPGKADTLSLRIGLSSFSEGITLSYAETSDNSEDYKPFIPFTYFTDPQKKKSFILYYEPQIEIGRGPIVLHGGFTSAFYDFQEDGTGRLVISIACWLIRKEELYLNRATGI